MSIKGVNGTGTYLKNMTEPIEIPKNHRAALIKNHFTFSPKVRFVFFFAVGFGLLAGAFFGIGFLGLKRAW